MNLTIIRELLLIYRTGSNENTVDESKLEAICDKIKSNPIATATATKITARNSAQLASACWNLLAQINGLASLNFSGQISFLQTSKVVLSCSKVIESARNELKMGQLDLDKMLANLIAKLTDGYRRTIISETTNYTSIIELIEFFFERLQGHFDSLESGIRRMSLVEFSTIDDPFVDVKFHGISPEVMKDHPTIKQLCVVALESLCKLVLIFQKGPIKSISEILTQFHLDALSNDPEAANKHISHFVSGISKLEFHCQLEWKLWNHLCKFEVYDQFSRYFRKRCHLQLTSPDLSEIPNLNMKIIAIVIESGQLTDLMLQIACSCTDFADEIIGVSLKLLIKEDSRKYLPLIELILERTPKCSISDSGLLVLLPALDSLRSGLFHLMRDDEFIKLFAILNDVLDRIDFPIKFYVSWTSCVLKFAADQRKLANIPLLVKALIAGLLKVFDGIPEDMKPKIQKIIAQTVSISGDCDLLRQFTLKFEDSIATILEASLFNLPQKYFIELGLILGFESDFHFLASWVKVLTNQVQVTSYAFQFKTIICLHSLAKIISKQVFDQFKSSQYLEFIYNRMRELGCDQETILLSQHLASSSSSKQPVDSFTDPNVYSAINFLKVYKETGTGKVNFDILQLNNVKIKSDIELELYDKVLNLIFIHAPERVLQNICDQFDISVRTVNRLKSLETNCRQLIDGTTEKLFKLHSIYLKGEFAEALKVGYEKLKISLKSPPSSSSSSINALEITELIIYLFRLAVSTKNLSEARYFLKQLFHLAETVKSENIRNLADRLQTELVFLMGNCSCAVNYSKCEGILKSRAYEPFEIEYQNLMELEKIRDMIRRDFPSKFPVVCNGIKVNNLVFEAADLNEKASNFLKASQRQKNVYCSSEWAKISLFLNFHKSLRHDCDCDSELLNLFEMARNPNYNETSLQVNRLKGSIGLLHDQLLSVLWIMIISLDSKIILFKINLNIPNFMEKLQKIHEICSQNTDTLKNTKEIGVDPEKKAKWWKLRKSLDSELSALCHEINEDLFANLAELLIPYSSSSSVSRNLFKHINDLIEKLVGSPESIRLTETFVGQLIQWGQFPRRFKIENLIKMIKSTLNCAFTCASDSSVFDDQDSLVIKFRNCFENSFEIGSMISSASTTFNLILDKDLNAIPFESFPLLNIFSFKRIPLIMGGFGEKIDESAAQNEILRRVFYIINPSGDLLQTQERFESLFKSQPNWEGIIGRKPTINEFFNGICGDFDLFIYFGHSGGEIYAPLKELKLKLSERRAASSALLVGCSSGRIKSNGIFLAESSIFHYLENESPLILANLWDVTDKDIDIYIKGVLEDSDLLLPMGSETLSIQTTASQATIIEKAQVGRQRCYLKALNGYAPIVYGLI